MTTSLKKALEAASETKAVLGSTTALKSVLTATTSLKRAITEFLIITLYDNDATNKLVDDADNDLTN